MKAGRLAIEAFRDASRSRARLLSVHERAINIELENGDIVALLPADSPIHPWAILVPNYDNARARLPERGVFLWDERGSALQMGPARIHLGKLKVEDLRIARRTTEGLSPEWPDLLERATWNRFLEPGCHDSADGEKPGTAGSDHPPSKKQARLNQAVDDILARVVEDDEFDDLEDAIGQGSGLTPSGDDAVVGVFAALDFLNESCARAGKLRDRLARAFPWVLEEFTPRLSAQMLRAARDGRYPEPLLELCNVLADPVAAPSAIESAAVDVLRLGHDSGLYLLRGFRVGLLLLKNPLQ